MKLVWITIHLRAELLHILMLVTIFSFFFSLSMNFFAQWQIATLVAFQTTVWQLSKLHLLILLQIGAQLIDRPF